MIVNSENIRKLLKEFDFAKVLVNELGWNIHRAQPLVVTIEDVSYTLNAVAEKCGMAVYACSPGPDGLIPPYPVRRKIEQKVAKAAFEHMVIFVDSAHTTQTWQWVKREAGKQTACRETTYHTSQSGEPLVRKLQNLAFSLEEEDRLTIVDVVGRAREAFDVERVTKRFYDRFKAEHEAFMSFLKGIPDEALQRWYVSVMLNRLMFIYFIQKKNFLDNDADYLRGRLDQMKQKGKDRFYKGFLCPLFFEGFARKEAERTAAMNKLLGKVPYLNGGLFLKHQIEELYGEKIQLADAAFEKLFDFFEQYQWHLDERPLRADNEINPDVLGYIFEKYINQKQMGAYYTKEDITGYISRNTVIPFLFDAARKECPIAFDPDGGVWRLLKADPDRYIYLAVKKGKELELPVEIAAGLNDVSKRGDWNKPAPPEYALPTEIWREVVARRKRYEEIRTKLAAGEIKDINDLITYNLDIERFAQDVIINSEGPELIKAFGQALEKISVLDPTCGSGAFLFAALNILEPLYSACLEGMQGFLDDIERSDRKRQPDTLKPFREVLEKIDKHPNRRYFVLKSIMVNNLYGVDIMEEAVEICKLRLFLKLVAQVEKVDQIEPLPDIDFNIRAGNTLVGFSTYEGVLKALTSGQLRLDYKDILNRLEQRAKVAASNFQKFRELQTANGVTAQQITAAKSELRNHLDGLRLELDKYLAGEYGVRTSDKAAFDKWRTSHQPFHWFVEFYDIMNISGFDVIIGNPPYVEYRFVRGTYTLPPNQYVSEEARNLYAFCVERSGRLVSRKGRFGMIIPAGLLGLDEALPLRKYILHRYAYKWFSTYSIRPSKLFDGVDQRLCIHIAANNTESSNQICTTRYHHWNTEERTNLFSLLTYHKSFLYPTLDRIPQIGNRSARGIFSKLSAKMEIPVSKYYASDSGFLLHYHRSPRYWIRAMDFEQYFKSPTRKRSIHHFRDLYFLSEIHCKIAGAIINSSLFFVWFLSVGNGRNITGTDIEQFPVGDFSKNLSRKLPELFDRLMKDFKKNSFMRVRQDCEFQEFRPSKSKAIIDEIDYILARHYGFTDEELDFIINYEIKYRMGQDSAGESDEE
jgi:hypothetical protein